MIGVNCIHDDPAKLKKAMEKEDIPWRTFAAKGEIAKQWNYPGTPCFYVIDPDGVIQRKWVGAPGHKTMETVLKKMIEKAEAKSPAK